MDTLFLLFFVAVLAAAIPEWLPQHDVSNEALNEQHSNLFLLIADLQSDRSDPAKLSALDSFLRFHFRSEEDLFAATRYLGANQHKKLHDDFLHEFTKKTSASNGVTEDFLSWMANWLQNHIIEADQLYKETLRKQPLVRHRIAWDPVLDIQNEALNKEHQNIIHLVNELDLNRDDPARLMALINYVQFHWKSEEDLFAATNFSGAAEHALVHSNFIRDAVAAAQHGVTDHVIDFIHHWLTEHILQYDMQYVQALKEMPLVRHPAQWDESLNILNEALNQQHQHIDFLINRLDENRTDAKRLTQLVEYVQFHWKSEEDLFDKTNFPGAAEHKLIHANFIKDAVVATKNGVTVEVIEFMKVWVRNHILRDDMLYSTILRGMDLVNPTPPKEDL